MATTTENLLEQSNKKPYAKKLFDFRVWTQTNNLKSEGILAKATRNQSDIRDHSSALNEEDDTFWKKNIRKNFQNEDKRSTSKGNVYLSDCVQKIVNDVSKVMKGMNASNEEIKMLNAHYLKTTTEKINKNTTINNNSNTNPNLITVADQEITQIVSLPKLNTYLTNSKNKPQPKLIENFKYVNDSYRKQLNRAFLNFNPIIHLGNLNLLRKADPEINEDINKLTRQIDDSLKEITSKEYYKNHYNKIKEENDKRKERERQNENCTTQPSTALLTTQPTECLNPQTIRSNYKPFLKKQLNSKLKSEQRKKFPFKEQREAELALMNNVLGKINQSINRNNLNRYFRDFRDMKALSSKDQQWIYFSDMKKAEEALKQLHKERILKKNEEEMLLRDKTYRKPDEDNMLKKVYENEKALMKTITNLKDFLLSEIKNEEEL